MSVVFERQLGTLHEKLRDGTIKAILVGFGNTCEDDKEAANVDDIADLDEYDGVGYNRVTVTGKSFEADVANDRVEFHSDPIVFAGLGAGSSPAYGVLLIHHVTNDADSFPLMFFTTGGFPFNGNGQDIEIAKPADGWVRWREPV